MVGVVEHRKAQRFPDFSAQDDVDRDAPAFFAVGECVLEFFFEGGGVVAVCLHAGGDFAQLEIPAELQHQFAVTFYHAVQAAPQAQSVFRVLEEDAVALAGECRDASIGRGNGDAVPFYAGNFAQVFAVVVAECPVDECLVVDSVEPAGRKPAREQNLERFHVCGGEFIVGVEGFFVCLGDCGHVFGALEAAFDFK